MVVVPKVALKAQARTGIWLNMAAEVAVQAIKPQLLEREETLFMAEEAEVALLLVIVVDKLVGLGAYMPMLAAGQAEVQRL